jgi:class 3 adenylate cyclase
VERFQGWIAGLRPLIEGHGGVINSYVGDAVFAWWPEQPGAGDELRSALAAIEAWRNSSPATFRLALHHGSALFTRSERGEELAGRDVNFVFRSDQVAKALGVATILSDAAVRSLGLHDRCRQLGEAQGRTGIEGRFRFFSTPEGPRRD